MKSKSLLPSILLYQGDFTHLRSSGGRLKSNIQENSERPLVPVSLNLVHFPIGLLLSDVHVSKSHLRERPPCEQKSGGIRGRVVCQTNGDAILGELVRIGGGNDLVTIHARRNDLGNNIPVRHPNHKPILGSIVLPLILSNQLPPSIVVRLPRPPPPWLHLIPTGVGLVLHQPLITHPASLLIHTPLGAPLNRNKSLSKPTRSNAPPLQCQATTS
mmetsp:Transcript_40602/g.161030  ORF Transcript_40602/g.161030 Transcript_40602/m.161030 type:complete len:215 (-) Transcript_40602:30-674(-)